MKLNKLAIGMGMALGLMSAASAQTVLKLGYATSATSHYAVGSTVFCDDIEKGTQGRYKCQQFPSGSLGGEREMIEAVQLGTLDLVNTSTGPVGNFVPEVKIVDIPFLFRDYDHARKVMDGPIGQDILTKFPSKGLIALAWTENGFRHMTNSKRPIVKPADASGLKMRTMENKVHMDGYKTFGIQPTPMAFPEVFGALQQGTVDGQENPIPVILASKFSQVQKHLSLTGHVYSPGLLITSPRLMNKLSDADKKVFYDAAQKAKVAQRKKVNEDENNGIAQLEKDGMTVVRKVDGQAFRDALVPAYASYSKEFGADNIRKIQEIR
ncbi:C4-dicarboxylate ABC transporter substrate-binding protein [Limnohabitans sp. MMS-10A-160]|jgi:TRAP-type transport system periplasmic protein|uniref:TRAP transporter substrate-binding protein n=1 Tax=unclassified Limnohabitans TaxID=2626134 RepID=UPI000D3AE063|nr:MULTISPECIES: TRAP transporter substrate-binding protein [unclassified Limnohabitans]PUE21991.1 C4-dicarboxylate ABC transporter substrate-binding protein [Limnohabitans sp. MMS-10A-192]PUE25642.1 C4-dicarboxylate ABC transporter substrate-binding protein [Limnohabitans sp. MMS-10A-160]